MRRSAPASPTAAKVCDGVGNALHNNEPKNSQAEDAAVPTRRPKGALTTEAVR